LPDDVPGAAAIETQLERIVSSAEFRKSVRMCRFLTLVIREALGGRTDTLKEYRIGTEVFDKDESFDPRVDPIVRNEARRLRRKLEIYYMVEGKSDPMLIQLPKGGYVPVFSIRPLPEVFVRPDWHVERRRIWYAVTALATAGIGWWMLGANRGISPARRATREPHAAEAYALGKHLLLKLTPEGIRDSRGHLETAARLDPAFSEAYEALALHYQAAVVFGLADRETGRQKSHDFAARATALSKDGAAGEAALAGHMALLEEDYAGAAPHFEQALARDAEDPTIHAQYAVTCLLQLGRLDDARREAGKAYQLDPQNGLAAYSAVLTDYCARDYGSAVARAHQLLDKQPESVIIPPLLIDSYLAMGRLDDAWFFIEKRGMEYDAYRALIRARKGDTEGALRLARQNARTVDAPVLTARLFAAAGDAAGAVRSLEEADRRHDFGARISARYAPDFDGARSSAGFAALLAAMTRARRP
jgi:tetratricopeptide (TPR) repeat protein